MVKLKDILTLDIELFGNPKKTTDHLYEALCVSKLEEIKLNPENATVITKTGLGKGEFTVGDIKYTFTIKNIFNPYKDGGTFYNISFNEESNPQVNIPTGKAGRNYIKILSTMYKVILDFAQQARPKYIGIASLEGSGYGNIYNNLSKDNPIPGYSRKDVSLDFKYSGGESGKMVVLKKNEE